MEDSDLGKKGGAILQFPVQLIRGRYLDLPLYYSYSMPLREVRCFPTEGAAKKDFGSIPYFLEIANVGEAYLIFERISVFPKEFRLIE